MEFKTYEEYEKFIKEFVTDKVLNRLVYGFEEEDERDILREIFRSYVSNELSKKMLSWLSKKFRNTNIYFLSNLTYCMTRKDNNKDIRKLDKSEFIIKRNINTLTVIYSYKIDEINQINSSIIKKALANQQLAKATHIKPT